MRNAYISSLKAWARLIRAGEMTPEELADDLDAAVAYIRATPPPKPKWGQFEVMLSSLVESDFTDFCVATEHAKVYIKANEDGVSVDIYGHGADWVAASCWASVGDLGSEE
jgi:hypothetical protein